MGRRRIRSRSMSSSTTQSRIIEDVSGCLVTRSKPFFLSQSRMIGSVAPNLDKHLEEKLFNKNISAFRQIFNQNDTSALPFMSSLRKNSTMDISRGSHQSPKNRSTIVMPFSQAGRLTANQTVRKSIFDIETKPIRAATAYYRWHNRSGVHIKNSTQFQCSLRDYGIDKNPEEQNFQNTIKPIKYQDVQPKEYGVHDIICPRQNRVFRVK